jgi:hypothetical protein
MRRHRIIGRMLVIAALALPATRAAADDHPATLGEAKAKEQLQALADVATLPILNADRPTDVISLEVKDDFLLARTKLPAAEQAVARAPGLPGLTRVRIVRDLIDPNRPPMEQFNFDNVDYTVPGIVALHTAVTQTPGKLTVTQDRERLDDEVHSIQLIQSTGEIGEGEKRIMLYVQITAAPEVKKQLGADNIIELRRKYPNETATYLDPIFRTLRMGGLLSRVDPRLAWQVFADAFVPSEKLKSDVKNVLAKLDADSFQDREAASRELAQLGQPAALTLMKMDRNRLTEEQRTRVDAFLSQFRTVPPEQAERYRRDTDFLLDCLFAEDQALRIRAL